MITPEEFISRWDSTTHPLVRYKKNIVEMMHLNENDKTFLVKVGMPESTSPFLNFFDPSTMKFAKEEIPSGYTLVGETGNGDFICIKEKTGEISIIDHEDTTRLTYMNSSISQLLEFILEYKGFINNIKEVNGKRAVIERKAPINLVIQLIKQLSESDNLAMQYNSFWAEIIDQYRKS
jgi:hypothetical protein